MRSLLICAALAATLGFAGLGRAAEVIDLWPEGVPGLRPNAGPETDLGSGRIGNINHPSLTVARPPAGRANGTAIIVCPGGGYVRLAFEGEAISVGRWLNSIGVTAFFLKYRLKEYGQPAPLQDVLRAVRLLRSRAAEFGIDPHRLGVMGFSAGGHLAACAGTLYDDPAGRTGAPLDAVSGRPDFLVLGYPVITMDAAYAHMGSRRALLGAHPTAAEVAHWSPELHVTAETPPTFIVAGEDDRSVPPQNSIRFFEALKRAGVPAELHLFQHGPHGFGLGKGLGPVSVWPELAADWMRYHRWLPQGGLN